MTARLFADLTMALEDMHRHAVEGQRRVLPRMPLWSVCASLWQA